MRLFFKRQTILFFKRLKDMTQEELTAHFRRYIPIGEAELGRFMELTEPYRIPKGRLLLAEGDICRHFNFVTKGILVNFYDDANGFQHVMQFALPFWWTGDLHSLMNGVPGIYSIKALADSEVLRLSRSALDELLASSPLFDRYFRIIFQNALIAHQRRITLNIAFPARERYLEFRERYPQVEQLVPQKYIASYLGITPEFLSKIRRNS